MEQLKDGIEIVPDEVIFLVKRDVLLSTVSSEGVSEKNEKEGEILWILRYEADLQLNGH